MLPADSDGKINYSPGTLRPVRKFGNGAVGCLGGECASACGGVIGPGRFGKPSLDQTAPLPTRNSFVPCLLVD